MHLFCIKNCKPFNFQQLLHTFKTVCITFQTSRFNIKCVFLIFSRFETSLKYYILHMYRFSCFLKKVLLALYHNCLWYCENFPLKCNKLLALIILKVIFVKWKINTPYKLQFEILNFTPLIYAFLCRIKDATSTSQIK